MKPQHEGSHNPFPIVGIGASAGGLDAFKRFLSELPSEFGFAIVFIQHLLASRKSLLPELLRSRKPDTEISEISEGLEILPGRIYLSPPGKEIRVQKGNFHVTPRRKSHLCLPVDDFFESLAEEAGERAIAVIFSGAGADGARGIQSIRMTGGTVFVQDPETAEFPGMPLAAIKTGQVDGVLTPEDMIREILKIQDAGLVSTSAGSIISPMDLQTFYRLIREKTGYGFDHYKKTVVARRIRRRMYLHGVSSVRDYFEIVRENDSEAAMLASDLMIGVTSFFRDRMAWKALKIEVARKFTAENDNSQLRVWTPACATGEEAYSVAMMLRNELDLAGRKREIQIFATDVNDAALEKAREGVYPGSIVADVPPDYIHRYFTYSEDGLTATIGGEIRDQVVFARQDLLTDPPFSRLDLIICRNLLIYFEPAAQEKCLAIFHYALKAGRYLFLGNAESPGSNSVLFKTLGHKKCHIYTKTEKSPSLKTSLTVPFASERAASLPLKRSTSADQQSTTQFVQGILLEEYAPAAVAVNQNYDILYHNGPTNRYLRQPRGAPTQNLMELLPENLQSRIRAGIYRADHEAKPVSVRTGIPGNDGKKRQVNLRISRLKEQLFLIVFRDKGAASEQAGAVSLDATEIEETAVRQLETELTATREALQSNIEQLKGLNEELQSSNEELQAANEELETSREELQSLNEELITVNSQLQSKIEEQEETNNDLNNFLSSTNIPTIFLDPQLRVKRFTPAMSRIIKLIPADVGRPIIDMSQEHLGPDFIADAHAVLDNLVPIRKEIGINGSWYVRAALPYRTSDNRIEGVVITYNEITELKRAEEAIRNARDGLELRVKERTAEIVKVNEELEAEIAERKRAEEVAKIERQRLYDVLETLPVYVVLLSRDYHVPFANKFFRERFGESHGKRCFEYLFGRTEPCEICETYSVLKTMKPHHWEWTGPDSRNYDIYDFPFIDADGSTLILEMGIDITERKQAEAELTKHRDHLEELVLERTGQLETANAQLQSIFDNLTEGLVVADLEGNLFHWNPAAVAMHGFGSMEEYQRRLPEFADIFELSTPEDGVLPVEQWPLARILRGETLQNCEVHLRRHGSEWRRIFSYGGTLARDKSGKPLLAIVTVVDITERKRTEEIRGRLSAVVESADDAIISKDLSGIIKTWNVGAEKIFGYTAGEVIGKNISLLVPPGHVDEVPGILARIAKGEHTEHIESVGMRKDGTVIPVSLTFSPIKDDSGRIIGASKIAHDITDLKEAEARILRQNAILESINLILQKAITCDTDEELGRVCLAIAEEVTQSKFGFIGYIGPDGLLHDIAISDPGWEMCTMYDKTGHRRPPGDFKLHGLYGRVLLDGKSFYTNDPASHPYSIGTPEGHPVLKAFLGVPMIHGGKTVGMIAVGNREGGYRKEDVDSLEALAMAAVEAMYRVRAEEAVRLSEDRLKRAQEIAHLGSWEFDPVNNVLAWSDEVYRIFGLQPQEFSATYNAFLEHVHPEDRAAVDAAYTGSIREGKGSYEIEHRVVRKGTGEIRWVHEKCRHVRDAGGKIICSIGMVHDITERRNAEEELRRLTEELKRSNADLQQFAYIVSHDLKEPLSTMSLFLKMLGKKSQGRFDDKSRELIGFVFEGLDRMKELIRDLLEYSRVGTTRTAFKPTDLNYVLKHAILDLEAAISESKAEVAHGFLPTVAADALQIESVFRNLIGNAIKFRRGEQPKIRISAEQKGSEWVISVSDNGIGIDTEHFDHIFTMFRRLHTQQEYEGTGVGLALCKRIIERHGGRIWVESEPAKGSIFRFTMPAN